MSKRFVNPLFLLIAAVFAVGCTTLGKDLIPPSLQVTGVQMMSSDMFAQRFKVRVLVTNPNDLELPVRGLDYQIILMGDSFAEGVSSFRQLAASMPKFESSVSLVANMATNFAQSASRM